MSVTITSLIPGVSYQAFLSQTESKPFKVKKTAIISTQNSQVEQSTTITYRDSDGKRIDHVITPTIDPYQELVGRIEDPVVYTFDGFTRVRFNQIAGNTTVVLKIYPAEKFDVVNMLHGKPLMESIAGEAPYVFQITNNSAIAQSNVDFGDAYTDPLSVENAGLRITDGTNAMAGNVTLVDGVGIVANTNVKTTTLVIYCIKTLAIPDANYSYIVTPGVGFQILSDNISDTNTMSYLLVELT